MNSDSTLELARKTVQDAGINWRSIFDGGREGPVASAWGISSWPHFVLIDAAGQVHFRQEGGGGSDELDRRIEALVRAAEAG